MNILHLDSSILGGASVTRELSAALVAKMKQDAPDAHVTYHDLVADPIPHMSGALYAAQAKPLSERSDAEAKDVAISERVMEEFLKADILVIGAPMYNFSISTQLKAWVDRINVAGKTFRYTANGPEGLAGGKKVIIVSSRGGIYSEGPAAAMDFQEAYLCTALGFIGITDVEYIRAEGVSMGPDIRAAAMDKAKDKINACPVPAIAA